MKLRKAIEYTITVRDFGSTETRTIIVHPDDNWTIDFWNTVINENNWERFVSRRTVRVLSKNPIPNYSHYAYYC